MGTSLKQDSNSPIGSKPRGINYQFKLTLTLKKITTTCSEQ